MILCSSKKNKRNKAKKNFHFLDYVLHLSLVVFFCILFPWFIIHPSLKFTTDWGWLPIFDGHRIKNNWAIAWGIICLLILACCRLTTSSKGYSTPFSPLNVKQDCEEYGQISVQWLLLASKKQVFKLYKWRSYKQSIQFLNCEYWCWGFAFIAPSKYFG